MLCFCRQTIVFHRPLLYHNHYTVGGTRRLVRMYNIYIHCIYNIAGGDFNARYDLRSILRVYVYIFDRIAPITGHSVEYYNDSVVTSALSLSFCHSARIIENKVVEGRRTRHRINIILSLRVLLYYLAGLQPDGPKCVAYVHTIYTTNML